MDDSEQGSNRIHAAEPFDEDLISSYLLEISDIYEESDLRPRVGEQYQVEIPPMETKSKLFQFIPISDDEAKMSSCDRFGIGLAIPVNWIQYGDNIKIKCEKEEHTNGGNGHVMDGFTHLYKSKSTQVEFIDSSDQDNHVAYSANHNIGDNVQKNYASSLLQRREAGAFYPLPGSPTFSLSEAEKQSFLLGLYIFGKNLVQVKKFMETKMMGDVLSFYYGNFYRSDAYRKWSECRKIRSRRSIHGQRIFTGWRQHELLSRILNSTPKELQDTLLEASKTFNEGRATLEEFVFRLKAAVGLKVLVEAIGIGKGTYDLTVVALDQVRANQPAPLTPEIPVGRACSSLTSADIIKFLTGDFRLSKARSNDLFWEAVWPRLLARGWHSEQPKNRGPVSFKNTLVFLVPGVKKFSKKKLMRGTHFFDSVSDVLSRVASDPGLLEFDVEVEKDCGGRKEENGWEAGRNGSSDHQQHSYMHLRPPNCTSECLKFTVVDTSLAQRQGSHKVMEVRSLPSVSLASCIPAADSEESGGENSSESSSDEEDSNHNSSREKKSEVNPATQFDLLKASKPQPGRTNGYAPGYKGLVELKDEKTSEMRYHNSRRIKSGPTNYSAPPSKRRKLATCRKGFRDCRAFAFVKSARREDSGPFQEKTNLYPHAKSKPENISVILPSNHVEHKLQSQTLIDLNNLPPDAYFTETTSNELKAEEISQSSVGKQRTDDQISIQYYCDGAADGQPSAGLRRQSTRNRPPTAKALEALASGFLGTKRSGRSANSSIRPPRKARKVYEELGSADVSSSAVIMSAAGTVGEDYERVARKGTHDLLGVP
ncbi:hypothetical protein KSP39_PZI017335 [Platanthera zijinensis]|uniref:SANT domain-containing protein n=1 Tax=Platanthera zijinensis TaxID=2320716 RepID=A0AAP0B6A5_9ASPA